MSEWGGGRRSFRKGVSEGGTERRGRRGGGGTREKEVECNGVRIEGSKVGVPEESCESMKCEHVSGSLSS